MLEDFLEMRRETIRNSNPAVISAYSPPFLEFGFQVRAFMTDGN